MLAQLQGVRRTGVCRWIARCPAHGDKHPSLSVRELPDGRVLFHCFGGCEAEAVLDAVGLSWADVLPERIELPAGQQSAPRERLPVHPLDGLKLARHELIIGMLAAADLAQGNILPDVDRARLEIAIERLNDIIGMCGGDDA